MLKHNPLRLLESRLLWQVQRRLRSPVDEGTNRDRAGGQCITSGISYTKVKFQLNGYEETLMRLSRKALAKVEVASTGREVVASVSD